MFEVQTRPHQKSSGQNELISIFLNTRLYSSRMHTTPLLPISPSMHCTRGMSGPGGVPTSGLRGTACLWLKEWCLPLALGGIPASGPGGCLPLVIGVVPASGPGWGCLPLVQDGWCIPACNVADPHLCGQNSWHTLLKIVPCPNFVKIEVTVHQKSRIRHLKLWIQVQNRTSKYWLAISLFIFLSSLWTNDVRFSKGYPNNISIELPS